MKQKLILFLIILIGFGLRVWQVDQLPKILNRDEAAIAYNAYLLKEKGQDEWGKKWPLTLESFGDFKLPGYPFMVVGLFKFFPMNDWIVRLPSVVAGTTLIWLTYLWGKRFYLKKENTLLATLLIALTPIFFFYSRIAFEANVALTLIISSLYCLFFVKPTLKCDIFGLILYATAVLTYNTPYLLLPFITILLIFHRGIKKWQSWIWSVFGLVLILGIFSLIFVPLTGQKKGITIFNDETTWNNYIQYRSSLTTPILQKTLGNRWIYNFSLMASRFMESFSWEFMVSKGGSHPWHVLPGKGHVYSINYFLGWVGIFVALLTIFTMIKNKNWKVTNKKIPLDYILVILMFISLLPSIVTVDSPHATRSLLFFYIFIILGVKNWDIFSEYLIKWLKLKNKPQAVNQFRLTTTILILIVISLESIFYFKQYFYYYPNHQPESLKVGLKEIVQEVELKYSDQTVAYVDGQGYDYILVAWYGKITADDFVNTIHKQLPDKIGFRYGDYLTHYHFIADQKDRQENEHIMVEWDGIKWSINQY